MNPAAARIALIIVAIGGAAFVAFMLACVLLYGCTTSLPPEPGIVMTYSHDAGQP